MQITTAARPCQIPGTPGRRPLLCHARTLRLLIGNDQRLLLPASALAGAAFLLAADTLARTVAEPLAGLLLSRQMRYAQAEDLLKAAFVQASARAFAAQGKVPTVSNLSVASGIRRPEVKRLLQLRILENDDRGVAAQFHRALLDGLRGLR